MIRPDWKPASHSKNCEKRVRQERQILQDVPRAPLWLAPGGGKESVGTHSRVAGLETGHGAGDSELAWRAETQRAEEWGAQE